MARCAAAMTGAGVGKSGSPISMCTTVRPAASSARAAVCTSITWNGAISATRAAVSIRASIESRSPGQAGKRYRNACHAGQTNACALRSSPPLAATLAACLPGSAPAAIYKCVGESSQPVYQDSPCPPGKELRNFDTDPADVSVIPFRAVPGTTTTLAAPKDAKPPPASKADKKKEIAGRRRRSRSASSSCPA